MTQPALPPAVKTTIRDHEVLIRQFDVGLWTVFALIDAREDIVAEALQDNELVSELSQGACVVLAFRPKEQQP